MPTRPRSGDTSRIVAIVGSITVLVASVRRPPVALTPQQQVDQIVAFVEHVRRP